MTNDDAIDRLRAHGITVDDDPATIDKIAALMRDHLTNVLSEATSWDGGTT